jgi:hypothetical protein
LATIENSLKEYQAIKSKFSKLRLENSKGIDVFFEKMKRVKESHN